MTKIINSIDGQRFWETGVFKSMLSDDYLTDNNNLQTKFIREQFFRLEPAKADERLALLNISYALPSLITEKFADYVGDAQTTLGIELDDFIGAFVWGGFCVMVPRLINGVFSIDFISPDRYIIEDDGTERILKYFEIIDANDNIDTYLLEQSYKKNEVFRVLYKVSKLQGFKNYAVEGEPVDLNTIVNTQGLLKYEKIESIDYSPLVKIHNRKLKETKYGTSEIRKVRSLISSIEIAVVNIQDQFLKHLQAKLAMPKTAMKIDENGIIDVRGVEVFGLEVGDITPSYVMNANPLIDKSFQQIEDLLRQICAILTIPTEFMGLKDGGSAESADTKKIRLVSFIKKIEKIRSKFEKAFIQINEIKKIWSPEENDDVLAISWPAIFPDDPVVLANELQIAQDGKMISNLKAIMRFQNIDEAAALEEQKIIRSETQTIDTSVIPN